MSSIIEPHENDILLGRGGRNNQHIGNSKLRALARRYRENYRLSSKKGKSYISREIVKYVREKMSPPGRFLKRSNLTGEWEDVGDEVAREKTRQVLRDAVSSQLSSSADASSVQIQCHMDAITQEHRRVSSAPTVVMARSPSYSERLVSSASAESDRSVSFSLSKNTSSMHCTVVTDMTHLHSTTNSCSQQTSSFETSSSASDQLVMRGCSCIDRPKNGLLGDLNVDMNEFDLFDGDLLRNNSGNKESGDFDPDLRSSTF